MTQPKRVLFLCTGNSARSQMAEGLLRNLGGDRYEVYSAGTEPTTVRPEAIDAMRAIDIDISHHFSKSLNEFIGDRFDYVIAVCSKANEYCPTFPGDPERIAWDIDDPAAEDGPERKRDRAFERVRDDLQRRITLFVVTDRDN